MVGSRVAVTYPDGHELTGTLAHAAKNWGLTLEAVSAKLATGEELDMPRVVIAPQFVSSVRPSGSVDLLAELHSQDVAAGRIRGPRVAASLTAGLRSSDDGGGRAGASAGLRALERTLDARSAAGSDAAAGAGGSGWGARGPGADGRPHEAAFRDAER